MKRIITSILVLFLLLCISCNPEPEAITMPKIKGIINYDSYDSIGVGATSIASRAIRSTNLRSLIGTINDVIQKVEFYGENNEPISETLNIYVVDYNLIGDYLFLSLGREGYYNPETYCLYIPTGDLFNLGNQTSLHYKGPNDMQFECNGAVYDTCDGGVSKIYWENGTLEIKQIVGLSVSGFTFIFVDKYGNIFGTDWNPGHLMTTEGKLKNLPSSMTYKKGMNGIVYYEDGDEKGYFSETGMQIPITDGFYPSFIIPDLYSSYHRFYDFIEYTDGNTKYIATYEHGGFEVFRDNISKLVFSENGEYAEEIINYQENMYPNSSRYDTIVKGYQLIGKDLYVLSSTKFFKIDLTTGVFTNIHNTFFEYKQFEYIEDDFFRITAIDENASTVVVKMSTSGETSEISSSIAEYSTIILYPVAKR